MFDIISVERMVFLDIIPYFLFNCLQSVENELARNKTRTKCFRHDGANASHYRRPLNWTGDRPQDQV